MASCLHCSSTTFVCDCGRGVVIVEIVDTAHVGECERCGRIVDDACLRRAIPGSSSRRKGLVGRLFYRKKRVARGSV